jgi:integrative and conjugative element protein (TIGR02256 family)
MRRHTAIELPLAVLEEMEDEARRRFPEESGGVLLGYRYPSRREPTRVVCQIGPGPGARHRRHRFEPDGSWQDEQVSRAYEASGRTLSYLGDWHSHPGGGRRPSGLDRSTARSIAEFGPARTPHPLFLILHGGPGEWSVAAYRYRRRRLGEARLHTLSEEEPAE